MFLCLFQILEAFLVPWLLLPFSVSIKPSSDLSVTSTLASILISHSLCLTLLSFPSKDPFDYSEPTQIIQNNLFISKCLTSSCLQALLPCKKTYSQVLRLECGYFRGTKLILLPADGFTYISGSWQPISQDASVLPVISLSPNGLTQAYKIWWSRGSSSARSQASMYKQSILCQHHLCLGPFSQSKSHALLRFKIQRNLCHLFKGVSVTSHYKGLDTKKGRICGHFYNLL